MRSSRHLVLVAIAAVALAVGVVQGTAGAGESGGAGDTTSGTSQAGLVAAGEQLFLTSCISCHGVDGVGTPNGPPLTAAGEANADFMLRTGRMPMASSDVQPPDKPVAYTDTEIRQLVAYVGSLGDGPPIPQLDLDAADVTNGGQLFRANCAPCHNASGIGGALSYGRHAPSLQETGLEQVAEAMRVGPGQMPRFGPDVLTDQEVNDIVAYVDYLQNPDDPGGLNLGYTGPVAEGFVALVIGLGALMLVIRWITRERRAAGAREGAPDA